MAKIIGHGAPTSKTFGVLGQEYFDKDSNKVYTCTKVTHKTAYRAGEADAEYEWTVIGNDPFEIKMEPVDLVLNQDVLFQYHPDDQYRWEEIGPCEPLVADQEYTVIWDGVEYKCFGIADEGLVYIGNPGLWWPDVYEDDGTPFCFVVDAVCLKCCIHAPGEEVTHNITVSTVNRIINKIDYEFMPEGYPKVKTKVVEIAPLNSLTATGADEWEAGIDIPTSDIPFTLEYGKKYIVTINGKDYTGECFDMGDGPALDIEENGKWIFWIAVNDDNAEIYWNAEFGETINLGLSVIEEIITPMDSRFVGGGMITLHTFNWDTDYVYKDKNGNEKITREEILSLVENGYNIVVIYWEAESFKWYSNSVFVYVNWTDSDFAYIDINKSNGATEHRYTAEYIGGPM